MEGNLSGIWLSRYTYSHGVGEHRVILEQDGEHVTGKSLQGESSELSIDLTLDSDILTGGWREWTAPEGRYRGKQFYGVVQLVLDEEAKTMVGKWAGFNSDKTKINSGDWTLERTDENAS